MKTRIEIKPCPYTDSILFQFILTEILHAHNELDTLAQLFKQTEFSHSTFQTDISQKLFHTAKQFSGASFNLPSPLFRQQEQGTLAKLKHYTLFFQQESQQRELLKLKKLTCKGLILSIELYDIAENSLCLKQFGKTLAKINKNVNSLQEPLIKLIPQFSDDENVILFMVRHQRPLDNIFGKAFTVNQLQEMHTSVQNSAQFLLNSFARRRFDQLLPIISQKIADIECVT